MFFSVGTFGGLAPHPHTNKLATLSMLPLKKILHTPPSWTVTWLTNHRRIIIPMVQHGEEKNFNQETLQNIKLTTSIYFLTLYETVWNSWAFVSVLAISICNATNASRSNSKFVRPRPRLEIEIPFLSSQISLDFDQFSQIRVLSPNEHKHHEAYMYRVQTKQIIKIMHIKMSRYTVTQNFSMILVNNLKFRSHASWI